MNNNDIVMACKNVGKIYHDGDRELSILSGVNLDVYAGEVLAISGPSGVGKSTLLHIMGTLDQPSEGKVYFQGSELNRMGRKRVNYIRNEEIGFVFQFYHLLPEFTALENVMMPGLCMGKKRSVCLPRAHELLAQVGLTDRITHKPGQLSGGEQQRVAIARAIFNNPSIVLSDEPTGNLDETTGQGIIDLLWRLNKDRNVTLVIVTHDEHLAKRADRWVQIHEGKASYK